MSLNPQIRGIISRRLLKYFGSVKDITSIPAIDLLNNDALNAQNAANTAQLGLIKADALNRTVFPNGGFLPSGILVAVATVTLAQLKAGATVLAAVTGQTVTPVGFRLKFTGTFTTSTTIRLSDTASSPVDIATVAIANATDGNILTEAGGTGLTIGAGFRTALTLSKGMQLRDVTANTSAGGTSIDVTVYYTLA